MRKALLHIACIVLAAVAMVDCKPHGNDGPATRRVVLMYAAAFSNLSPYISEDVEELCESEVPKYGSGDILLVYSHSLARPGAYSTPTKPVLFRVYKDKKGVNHRDTLNVYPDTDVSASPETLHKILSEVKEKYPARGYGMVFSSHAKGWLPPGYEEESPISFFSIKTAGPEYPLTKSPGTKELGIESADGSGIDIRDLPGALPMKLDFLVIDACLMGCVELAYEIKDKCDYLIASPAEVLSDGLVYQSICKHLFASPDADLESICREYYECYESKSGLYRSATITLVDCRKIQALADACKAVLLSHPYAMEKADRDEVQKYFYNDFHWFYDLRDAMEKSGASSAELAGVDAALRDCVPYHAATEKFFNLELKRVCGLSMYLPLEGSPQLNKYYSTLSWNKATGLIQ